MNSLITEIGSIFHGDRVNIEDMEKILHSYKSNPHHWRQYAMFDERNYTRNLVDTGNGKYNMIILCWGPGMCTNIHDHSGSHCFVKVLEGQLKETRFAFPSEGVEGKPLCPIGESVVSLNDVSYMSDQLGLHRMENPSHSENAVSLHVYSPAYDECNLFDQRTSQRHKSKVTFWSRYGRMISDTDVLFDRIQTSSRQG
ncbi:cysteine dioxygenase type I [Dictyocaulus viviparus]|uniref:Cysteine dioxygenase n=1 Tax=Dictyocaulus viviparus TaxID=29172 RepID=A0A0D8XPG5_DICVI|nr:cysteine dioxygenase type I [Dictyocaulus viviparus]